MSLTLRFIYRLAGKCVVAMSALLSLSLGAGAAEVIPPMHVQLAPEVRQQIERLPDPERVRIKKAMSVANRFVTMRFAHKDYGVYSVAEDSDRWDRQVGSLMAMDDYQWGLIYDREGWSMAYHFPEKRLGSFYLVSCDAATLAKLQSIDGGYALTYRTRLLGIYSIDEEDYFHEHYPGESPTYELTVVLNKNLKVQALRTPNKTVAINVKYVLMRSENTIRLSHVPARRRIIQGRYLDLRGIANRCESDH